MPRSNEIREIACVARFRFRLILDSACLSFQALVRLQLQLQLHFVSLRRAVTDNKRDER